MSLSGREEQVFEREEVLGRDATSVFPTETKAKPLDSETVNAMLGSNLRFITETEVPVRLQSAFKPHIPCKAPLHQAAGRCGRARRYSRVECAE